MKFLRILVFVLLSQSVALATVPDYQEEVTPVLNKYCVGCHSQTEREAELALDTLVDLRRGGENGASIDTDRPEKSLLLGRITGDLESRMPPEDEPQPSDAERQLLVRWILSGGPGPQQAATRQLNVPQLPPSQSPKPVTALAVADDVVATGRFGQVQLIDRKTNKSIGEFLTAGKVNDLGFSQDARRLIAASGIAGLRGEVTIWDVPLGKRLQVFTGHNDTIYAAQLSPDGSLIATASYDREIVLWNTETGEVVRSFLGHNGAVYDLDFSPDGQVLASASADATIKIWHVASGQRLDTLGQPLKEQYAVDISPDGKYVVAGGEDNRIRMWKLLSTATPQINPLVHARFAHDRAIQNVAFDNQGDRIVSSSEDATIKIWAADSLDLLQTVTVDERSTQALALGRNAGTLLQGSRDGSFRTYRYTLPRPEQSLAKDAQTAVTVLPGDGPEMSHEEREPNDQPTTASVVQVPAKVAGRLFARDATADVDTFGFHAKEGETWILEIQAARDGSPLDSHIAVLDHRGDPVERVKLQAVRDSYFTFRGKDSNTTGDFRLHNWEEMQLNQFLYASGEVVKLFHYPRGPDSGFNVYPNFGSRYGYFDTTPLAHALHEPCYIVEPHAPDADLAANGLPTFVLHYENDDDSQRRLGKDSRLTFVAPADGKYFVSVRDVRGFEGEDYRYTLLIRPPRPDFKAKLLSRDLTVSPGAGKKIGIEIERLDGFDGPVDVGVAGLPAGFSVPGPWQVERGHDRAWATLWASSDAAPPSEEISMNVDVQAMASIDERMVQRSAGSLGKIQLSEQTQLRVKLTPDRQPTAGPADLPVIELSPGATATATIHIERNGHAGRVGFGKEDGAVNAPHGVYVNNIGLNGVLIVEGQHERQIFITAEPWVQPMERVIFVEAGEAGKPTSNPVLLRILPQRPESSLQASR